MLDEPVTASANTTTSQGQNAPVTPGEPTGGKWYSASARRSGAGTAYPGDRGSGRGSTYSSRTNDMRKQGSNFSFSSIKIIYYYYY